MPRRRQHGAAILQLLCVAPPAISVFVGPFGPRTPVGSATTPEREPPPTAGGGLTKEEVHSLLRHRHALVIAGDDVTTALGVAEGLVEVGASVVLGCLKPERKQVRRAAERIDAIGAGAADALAALQSDAQGGDATDAGGAAAAANDAAAAAGDGVALPWRAGCEVRQLDLSTASGVCGFAESYLAEGRPLHVIVNCADDMHPFLRRAVPKTGWELTAGTNHLGPFLLTQLLLDRVVSTMRSDAKAHAAERKQQQLAPRGGRRGRRSASRTAAGALEAAAPPRDAEPLVARPHPAPLGKVVSLGMHARLGRPRSAGGRVDPPAVRGLYLTRANYSGWAAYRCAHEANTLASMQLSAMLPVVRTRSPDRAPPAPPAPHSSRRLRFDVARPCAELVRARARAPQVRTPCGEHVDVNVVRPARGRWLPAPLRRALGTCEHTAMTVSFLASTPMRGLSGLYFADFATEPAWSKSAVAPLTGWASQLLYRTSMGLIGAPPAEWKSEAAMIFRGLTARGRQPAATIRGRRDLEPAQRHAEPPAAGGAPGARDTRARMPLGTDEGGRSIPLPLDVDAFVPS